MNNLCKVGGEGVIIMYVSHLVKVCEHCKVGGEGVIIM